MKTRLIAVITATALAVTAAAPAKANGDLALQLALNALDAGWVSRTTDAGAVPGVRLVGDQHEDAWWLWRDLSDRNWQGQKSWQPGKNRRKTIPGACVFKTRGHGGRREYVSPDCLDDFGVRGRLPRSCWERVRTRWGRTAAYDLDCLEDKRYRVRWSHW